MQKLHELRRYVLVQRCQSRGVAAGPSKTFHESAAYWVIHARHDNRDDGGGALRRAGSCDGNDNDYAGTPLHQLPGKCRKALVVSLRPMWFEHIVLALDQSVFPQALL